MIFPGLNWYSRFVCSAIAAAFPISALSQSVSTQTLTPTCKATIFDVEREIEDYQTAYVTGVSLYNIQRNHPFRNQIPINLLVTLDAANTEARGDVVQQSSALDILKSPQMLRHYSQTIIENCQDIVSVNFLLTEYQSRRFGLIEETSP